MSGPAQPLGSLGADGASAPGAASQSIEFRAARADDGARLVEFFERAESSCFCQYWAFAGDHRDWQMRRALEPEQNRAALLDEVASGHLLAVVAVARDVAGGEVVVGFSRLGDPALLARTYQGRLYRGLPCLTGRTAKVVGVGCFLVLSTWRRRGVARGLLAAAETLATERGYELLDGFARRAEDVPDEEYWTGTPELFARAGFELVSDFEPYPVFTKQLLTTNSR